MRRVTAVLVLLLAMTACGDGDDNPVAAEDTTTTTREVTTTTLVETTTTPTTVVAGHVKKKQCVSAKSQSQEANNQPLSLQICIDDANPRPTQRITLTVTADDPDAPIGTGDCDIYVNWEGNGGTLCRDALVPPGPNDPQRVPEHGHVVKSYDHVYTDAGQNTVSVTVWSGPGDGHPDPYDNYAQASLPISVK